MVYAEQGELLHGYLLSQEYVSCGLLLESRRTRREARVAMSTRQLKKAASLPRSDESIP